jgi:hypothetical protein
MRLRVQIAVAATILVGGLLGGLLAFSDRQVRLAGTNSVGPKDRVARLAPGQRLCVRDLRVPRGAGAVSLYLGTGGLPPARVDLTLDTTGGPVRTAARAVGPAGEVAFPLPRDVWPGPARLCLRPRGGLERVLGTPSNPFIGVNYLPRLADVGLRPNATVDGRPVPDLVAVRFPERRPATRLARLDDAARRATVFKPGWVGTWTFGALLVLVPLLWAAGLATLWRVQR